MKTITNYRVRKVLLLGLGVTVLAGCDFLEGRWDERRKHLSPEPAEISVKDKLNLAEYMRDLQNPERWGYIKDLGGNCYSVNIHDPSLSTAHESRSTIPCENVPSGYNLYQVENIEE